MPGITTGSHLIFKDPRVAAPLWHHIDAKGHVVGKLATKIAKLLLGKHKPFHDRAVDCGDYVVITNAKYVTFTGRKWDKKYYKWHTGYVGGLKSVVASKMLDRHPEKIIQHAVLGMIPKNKLKKFRKEKLKIFPEADHHYHVEIASQPASAFAVKIGENQRWLKNREITESEKHLVGGYEVTSIKGPDGNPILHKQRQVGFLERAAAYRRMIRKHQVGELEIQPRPLPPPRKLVEVPIPDYHPMGDPTKPLPVGKDAKYFHHNVARAQQQFIWPTGPMTTDDVLAREATPEEVAAMKKEEDDEIQEKHKELLDRLEEWRLEHKLRFASYDFTQQVYYSELLEDEILRARLAAQAATVTTTVKDPRVQELMKKKEQVLTARGVAYNEAMKTRPVEKGSESAAAGSAAAGGKGAAATPAAGGKGGTAAPAAGGKGAAAPAAGGKGGAAPAAGGKGGAAPAAGAGKGATPPPKK